MAVFLPSDTSTIRYEETDLASLHSRPSHFVCGVYLICVRGTAVVSTGVQQYALGEQTELIFLTGSLIQVLCASDDFTVRLLMFPKEVFLKAVLPIDTPYLNYTHEHPCYRHTEDERSQATWLQINLWMDMAQMLFCGNVSPFRQQQEYNFLQGLLMWLFNTIQEKLERILQEISGVETEVFGSGRTDAGTHATGQVMNFRINWNGTAEQLLDAFNAKLPEDIAAVSVAEMPPRFHSRLSAKAKHYSYSIWIGKHSPVFERKYTFRCTETLDVQAMRQAAAAFIGTHDFKSFCANKRMKKSTVRTIYDIVFEETEDKLTLHFYGNGFLYQMVRILAGTLIEVGEGKKNADETEQILLAKSREQAGFTAPSRGLFLREVFYEDWKGGSEA